MNHVNGISPVLVGVEMGFWRAMLGRSLLLRVISRSIRSSLRSMAFDLLEQMWTELPLNSTLS